MEEVATHSSILAWEIPWIEEPGRLQAQGHKGSDMTEHSTVAAYKNILNVLAKEIAYVHIIKILTFNIYRTDVINTNASGLETNCFLLVESFPDDRHGPSASHQTVRLTCKSPDE